MKKDREAALALLRRGPVGVQEWNDALEAGLFSGKVTEFLARVDLSGLNLNEVNLRGVDLHGANLANSDLVEAELEEADLVQADLSKVKLIRAKLGSADLSGANLSGADLRESSLDDADLSHADLEGADLRDADLSGAWLVGANLSGANLAGANLAKSRCDKAVLDKAILNKANLSDARLIEAHFISAKLVAVNLSEAALSSANLFRADLTGATLTGANLAGANLAGAALNDTKMAGVNLDGANLRFVVTEGSDRRATRINRRSYDASAWSRSDLINWQAAGASLSDDLAELIGGDQEGLTLYFDSRLSTFSRVVVELAIHAVLGKDTDCHLIEYRRTNESAIVRLAAENVDDLELVAEVLWNRAWERAAGARTRESIAPGENWALMAQSLRDELARVREVLAHIELRGDLSGDAVEMLNDQGDAHVRAKHQRMFKTWGQKVLGAAGKAVAKRALGEIGDEVGDMIKRLGKDFLSK